MSFKQTLELFEIVGFVGGLAPHVFLRLKIGYLRVSCAVCGCSGYRERIAFDCVRNFAQSSADARQKLPDINSGLTLYTS